MQSFQLLSEKFNLHFSERNPPLVPASLYAPHEYILQLGGKRIRPVLCLMGNELFDEIHEDAWHVGAAIELFHNFTLIHDDIMDKAPLRRGQATVHEKFGTDTALLAGDVMFVSALEELNKATPSRQPVLLNIFNETARKVCEGQQYDMDYEKASGVGLDEYMNMITLKTSVTMAASLKMGAIIGGALERNQNLIYEFGKKLGIAFQVQDDYLDAFGEPERTGKQPGGDILANKKTFLVIHVLEQGNPEQKKLLQNLQRSGEKNKVERIISLYKDCGADAWARQLKDRYMDEAMQHLEDIAVITARKKPLKDLAEFLVIRNH
jgi:geranylgeranyl diphosphate synthase, type II